MTTGHGQETPSSLETTTITGQAVNRARQQKTQMRQTPVVSTRTVKDETEKHLELLPSLDTLTAAEMATYQLHDLESVLNRNAGLTVVTTGQQGSATSLFVRGMESNHTVVLLNGRRLPPGLAGMYQLEWLDTSTLESVQLTRGAISALYGADAMAGALDLRSTDARHLEGNSLTTYAEAGSFSTFRTGTQVTLKEGPVGVAFDTGYLETANDRPFAAFENRYARTTIAVELAEGVHFDLLGYLQDGDLEVPGSRLSVGFPQQQLNFNESSLISPRLTIERDAWSATLLYSRAENTLIAIDDPWFADYHLKQISDEFEAVFHYHPTDDATYTLGLSHYQYQFDRTALIPGFFNPDRAFDYSWTGLFSQADLKLPAHFHLLLSGRYDFHEDFESKATYSAQLNHELQATGTVLFGKVSTGYKAPSGMDFIYLNPTLDPGTIAPEEARSWEIGFKQPLFDQQAQVSLTYFSTHIDNLVDSDPFTFIDPAVVDVETSGFELEFRARPSERWEVYANYTYLDTEVVDGIYLTTYHPGERLVRRPRHTVNLGAVYAADQWRAGVEVSGAFDRLDDKDFLTQALVYVDDFVTTRIFAEYDLSDRLQVYARIENLFDESYDYTTGYEASGFGAYAGFRFTLGR